VAEHRIVEVRRPDLSVFFQPEVPARRIQLIEIDPTTSAEAHELNCRFAVLCNNNALAVLSGGDEFRQARFRFA